MAEIEWKGIVWKAAYGDLTISELLTILKGFGPMETLDFEMPGCFRGQLSVSLTKEGTKEITVYHLEVAGAKRRGQGRAALGHLRRIFKGEVYVEDPGEIIRVKNANQESLLFWMQMFREGLIDSLESEGCVLNRRMAPAEVDQLERNIRQSLENHGQQPEHEGKK